MTVDAMKDAKFVSELFDDLAVDAEALGILLELVASSPDVPDRLKVAFSSFATMADALSDRAQAHAELMRERAVLDIAEQSASAARGRKNVVPFSQGGVTGADDSAG